MHERFNSPQVEHLFDSSYLGFPRSFNTFSPGVVLLQEFLVIILTANVEISSEIHDPWTPSEKKHAAT